MIPQHASSTAVVPASYYIHRLIERCSSYKDHRVCLWPSTRVLAAMQTLSCCAIYRHLAAQTRAIRVLELCTPSTSSRRQPELSRLDLGKPPDQERMVSGSRLLFIHDLLHSSFCRCKHMIACFCTKSTALGQHEQVRVSCLLLMLLYSARFFCSKHHPFPSLLAVCGSDVAGHTSTAIEPHLHRVEISHAVRLSKAVKRTARNDERFTSTRDAKAQRCISSAQGLHPISSFKLGSSRRQTLLALPGYSV